MDSSPVLRQQSQNKIHPESQRMKNDQNRKPAVPKTSSSHRSNKDSENKDPGRKAPVRPGGSRLPVLAKSLSLQTPSNFSQSHGRWEEKPLAGKAKKKKPCTRPVPFNFSQPRGSRMTTEKQPLNVLKSQTVTRAMQPEKSMCKTKPTKHPAVLTSGGILSKGAEKSQANTTEAPSHPSAQSGPCSAFKTSATLSDPKNSVQQNKGTTLVVPAVTAEICVDDMKQLSLKDPSKTSHANQTTQNNPLRETFQSDHTALLSILRNEGVSVSALTSATPQSKPSNCLPQRVSVMKSQQKTGCTAGPARSVQFSPDPAALQSILLNKGVKAGGPAGATPRNSVCPPGRGTSIYTAQRVPLRKHRAEAADGAAAVALKETPLKKWTPQRVRDTRNRPMSAVKWHLSTLQSPYVTPGVRSCKNNHQLQQEEVVQRLFDDQEDEQSTKGTDEEPDAPAERHQVQASESKSSCDEKAEAGRITGEETQRRFEGGPTFFQAPHRESVIFFSTGKKLFRAPAGEKQDSCSALQDHQKLLPARDQVPAESEPTRQINPSERLHRGFTVQKTTSLSPAVAILRKRLPPLEDLRMDEEVATYTSLSARPPPGFLPPRPRCGNPLASYLHFEESTRFVPIGFAASAAPSSPLHD